MNKVFDQTGAEWKTENVLLCWGCTQQTVARVFVHQIKEFLASKGKCKLWVDPENPDLHALWRVIWCVKLRRGKEPNHGFNVPSQPRQQLLCEKFQYCYSECLDSVAVCLESAEMRLSRGIPSKRLLKNRYSAVFPFAKQPGPGQLLRKCLHCVLPLPPHHPPPTIFRHFSWVYPIIISLR